MKYILFVILALLLLDGCGSRCFYARLELVYLDKATDDKSKRPLQDYKIYIDSQTVPIAANTDGTFQICDLKKKKRPDRVIIMLDGRKIPSAQAFAERGTEKDPWIIKAAGPIEGTPAELDTTWVPAEKGSSPRQKN